MPSDGRTPVIWSVADTATQTGPAGPTTGALGDSMEVFIGTILPFGFNYAPVNWALCQGQIMAISQNSALFALLGTMYGGNGVQTFALPDLQGRMPIGMGNGAGLSPRSQGEIGGTENATLLVNNLPTHTHASPAIRLDTVPSSPTNVPSATNNYLGASGGGPGSATIWSNALGDNPVPMAGVDPTVGATGNNMPVALMNPFLALNFSIALTGIFPSRG